LSSHFGLLPVLGFEILTTLGICLSGVKAFVISSTAKWVVAAPPGARSPHPVAKRLEKIPFRQGVRWT